MHTLDRRKLIHTLLSLEHLYRNLDLQLRTMASALHCSLLFSYRSFSRSLPPYVIVRKTGGTIPAQAACQSALPGPLLHNGRGNPGKSARTPPTTSPPPLGSAVS